ncbi:hypothetical protein E3E14_21940 [Streptomyces sp. ICN441]|nr:hypothetical protein E3E14_21940 [Streptomyces sp. ICN441]
MAGAASVRRSRSRKAGLDVGETGARPLPPAEGHGPRPGLPGGRPRAVPGLPGAGPGPTGKPAGQPRPAGRPPRGQAALRSALRPWRPSPRASP